MKHSEDVIVLPFVFEDKGSLKYVVVRKLFDSSLLLKSSNRSLIHVAQDEFDSLCQLHDDCC